MCIQAFPFVMVLYEGQRKDELRRHVLHGAWLGDVCVHLKLRGHQPRVADPSHANLAKMERYHLRSEKSAFLSGEKSWKLVSCSICRQTGVSCCLPDLFLLTDIFFSLYQP